MKRYWFRGFSSFAIEYINYCCSAARRRTLSCLLLVSEGYVWIWLDTESGLVTYRARRWLSGIRQSRSIISAQSLPADVCVIRFRRSASESYCGNLGHSWHVCHQVRTRLYQNGEPLLLISRVGSLESPGMDLVNTMSCDNIRFYSSFSNTTRSKR